LFAHCARRAFSLALLNAGKSKPARIARMAMTTSNSIKLNPFFRLRSRAVLMVNFDCRHIARFHTTMKTNRLFPRHISE
jgi:hypothetical protein